MTTAAEFDAKYNIKNIPTPKNTLLAGAYKQSFAYYTFRTRLPTIITGIIDNLTKDKDDLAEQFGENVREEIKLVIGHLSKLKYQLQTDKPLEPLVDSEGDTALWNDFLENLPHCKNTYFQTCWLWAECYIYRRVYSIFKQTHLLRSYDYFAKQKKNAADVCIPSMIAVARKTRDLSRDACNFMKLLKLNLWGNRCDLSLTEGKEVSPHVDPFSGIENLEKCLLIDSTPDLWACMSAADEDDVVDFINDNAGYELFTDFILAEYIIDHKLAAKVRFNVKAIPWFISDVMPADFHWMLKYLTEHTSEELQPLGRKWTKYVEEGKFELMPADLFWTGPYEFYRMQKVNPKLYERLSKSRLLIFKGDLNYRKLLSDFNWAPTEDFVTCLQGFRPTNLATLRTVKADLICGLREGLAEELTAKNPNWMVTGEYGVIQFATSQKTSCPQI